MNHVHVCLGKTFGMYNNVLSYEIQYILNRLNIFISEFENLLKVQCFIVLLYLFIGQ